MTNKRDDDQVPVNPSPKGPGSDEPAPPTAMAVYNAGILSATPGAKEQYMAMLEQVPEPDDDASARIVMAILAAEDVTDLDAPWDAEGMRDWTDRIIRVKRVVRMPSAYTTGLGAFLVCTCEEPHIGEEFVLTTGSVAIVAQLVKAHVAGWLPLEVIPKQAERPSRNGYYPMHLEVVKRRGRARAAVIDQAPDVAAEVAAAGAGE